MPTVSSSPWTILRAIVVSERKFWPRLCLAFGRLLFQRAAEVIPCRQVVRGSGSLGAVRSEKDASQRMAPVGPWPSITEGLSIHRELSGRYFADVMLCF